MPIKPTFPRQPPNSGKSYHRSTAKRTPSLPQPSAGPVRQVDSSLSRKFEGTGLGLPLSEALARLHGGSLTLNSSPATGTTVTLVLPPERLLTTSGGGEEQARRETA